MLNIRPTAPSPTLEEMEEKVVDGKEKKYVLYTVVGEERGRAGVGVWVVRVLLGTLLLVALAVVPYLSLRLAQVSDRTLVVFQPVPVRNHSLHHHQHHVLEHGKQGHVDVVSLPQSAALTRENYTAESANTSGKAPPAAAAPAAAAAAAPAAAAAAANTSTTSSTAGGIVTLHESAVTLAVMEDTNATRKKDNDTDDEESGEDDNTSDKVAVEEDKKEVEENSTTEDTVGTSEAPASIAQVAAVTVVASPSTPPVVVDNTTAAITTTPAPHKDGNSTSAAPVPSTAAAHVSTPAASTTQSQIHTTGKVSSTKVVNVSSVPSTHVPNTTTTPTTTASTSSRRPLAHKLVYVATTASGNHIGGFCVWKTDNTIKHWSYFYENIPIEYQSHQDTSDHEMRGMLVAVRAWAPLWNDSHVVLRSHHSGIKGADHPTRRALSRELEKLSEGHFTYELEWRLRKTDRVVDISYCLSRLHRDYRHWYRAFQERVDELLGQQDWSVAKKHNRENITQEFFKTENVKGSSDDIPSEK